MLKGCFLIGVAAAQFHVKDLATAFVIGGYVVCCGIDKWLDSKNMDWW